MPLRLRDATQHNVTHSRTAHTRLTHDENKRTDAGVAKMKAQFSSCGKRSTKNQSEQLQQVAVGAMGLVCDEFGAPFARRRCGSCSAFEWAHTGYKCLSIVIIVPKICFCTISCTIYIIYKFFMESCAKCLTLISFVGKI